MPESPPNQTPVPINGGISASTAGQKRPSPLPPSGIPQAATKPSTRAEHNNQKEVTCFLLHFLSFLTALVLIPILGQCPQTRAPSTGAHRLLASRHPPGSTVIHLRQRPDTDYGWQHSLSHGPLLPSPRTHPTVTMHDLPHVPLLPTVPPHNALTAGQQDNAALSCDTS